MTRIHECDKQPGEIIVQYNGYPKGWIIKRKYTEECYTECLMVYVNYCPFCGLYLDSNDKSIKDRQTTASRTWEYDILCTQCGNKIHVEEETVEPKESISGNYPKHYPGDGEINGPRDFEWLKSILYSDISKTLEGCEQCENFSKKPANCFKPKESTSRTCKNCNSIIISKLGYCDNCGKYNSEHDQEVESIKNEITRTENHIEQLRKEREENNSEYTTK